MRCGPESTHWCMPERREIARRFSKSTDTYERVGEFHQKLAEQLVSALDLKTTPPQRILEIGAHTGLLTRVLKTALVEKVQYVSCDIYKMKPSANGSCQKIVADGEQPPFSGPCFDMIVSGATFQWFKDRDRSLSNLLKLLRPGGRLAFSQFLEPSLQPLKDVFLKYDERSRFLDLESVEEVLGRCRSFHLLSHSELEETRYFPDLKTMVAFLRSIGANASDNHKQPVSPGLYKKMMNELEKFREDRGLPLQMKAIHVVMSP